MSHRIDSDGASPGPADLDAAMQAASEALARMDYLETEARGGAALRLARDRADWSAYSRIVLPLQEARRQRRMIAAEGAVRLGAGDLTLSNLADQTSRCPAACVVVTGPPGEAGAWARRMLEQARRERRHVLVLAAEPVPAGDADVWRLMPVWPIDAAGMVQAPPSAADVTCDVVAPPIAWRDRWWPSGEAPASGSGADDPLRATPIIEGRRPTRTPADWFLDAAEALGDALLDAAPYDPGDVRRIDALEAMIDAAADHEILHQRLADAARACRRARPA